MTQRKRFKSQSLPSTLEGMPDRLSHIKVQHICHCYLLCGSNEKLYFNKFESNWHFITKSDMIFLPCHPQEGWASSWGRGVRHLIFNLVAGQFLGVGHFIFTLSPFSREGWTSSWEREVGHLIFTSSPLRREGWTSSWGRGVGHHIFNLVISKRRGLGQFLGEESTSPRF